jgi:hypothetical protein
MRVSKQAKREAKQIFELCSVNGLLDENRARQAARALFASGHRNSVSFQQACMKSVGHNW